MKIIHQRTGYDLQKEELSRFPSIIEVMAGIESQN
jgi:hypothetical protein